MSSDREQKLAELEKLQAQARQLEQQLEDQDRGAPWAARDFYTAYYATTGFMLGSIAAIASLMFNVVGAAIAGLHPLYIIKVYLTFPLGERALTTDMDSGLALAIGCCLYIGTGMVLGSVFQVVIARLGPRPLATRAVIASLLSVVIWLIAFYGLLSWLQPLLFDGRWIVDETPWYVAALTHLVFGLTMAVVFPLGEYHPYQRPSEQA